MRGSSSSLSLRGLQAERIEIGVEMAAHAIGADQHEGADGIAGRLTQLGIGMAGVFMHGPELGAERAFSRIPVAVEGGERVIARRRRNFGFPGRTLRAFLDQSRVVLQLGKEALPLRIDGIGIAPVVFIKLLGIGGIAAVEEGGQSKGGIARRPRERRAAGAVLTVGALSCHGTLRAFALPDVAPGRFHPAYLLRRGITAAKSPPRSCRAGQATAKPRFRRLPSPRSFLRRRPCRRK